MNKGQLFASIEKLFHYLFACITRDMTVTIQDKQNIIFNQTFVAPRQISISPSLYTRIDTCHGAGLCCLVAFDLIYTDYDRQRILSYDHKQAVEQFGVTSGEQFERNRTDLLDSLQELTVTFESCEGGRNGGAIIYIRQNDIVQSLSGRTSCPYLFRGDDRYYCGVHPFKPLHCAFPHMTIRVTQPRAASDSKRPSVAIGRAQYGRNHNFGCPVIFIESGESTYSDDDIWPASRHSPPNNYFDQQFQDDVDKLEWASRSAASLGFDSRSNIMVGIHDVLLNQRRTIERSLSSSIYSPITVWRRPNVRVS